MNAVATFKGETLDGIFSYNTAAGTILPIGDQTLKADFTPADTTDFNSVVDITSQVTVTPLQANDPSITLITPHNNASYIGPANIILSAYAHAGKSKISKVQFYNGAVLLHTSKVFLGVFQGKKNLNLL